MSSFKITLRLLYSLVCCKTLQLEIQPAVSTSLNQACPQTCYRYTDLCGVENSMYWSSEHQSFYANLVNSENPSYADRQRFLICLISRLCHLAVHESKSQGVTTGQFLNNANFHNGLICCALEIVCRAFVEVN